MIFRGALIRLAAWYLLLLALILLCFNVIVYSSLSQALHARAVADLRAKARIALEGLNVTGETVTLNASQVVAGPSFADACVFVVQTSGDSSTMVLNACRLEGLQKLPDEPSILLAKQGKNTETEVAVISGETFAIRTEPIKDKSGKIVGVVQVAKAISWIAITLNRLERQLLIASAVAMLLGALVAVLMAHKSLRPIRLAFQRQRDFVADASHELRTPLTLIRTNAEAWLRRNRSMPSAVYAQHALDEVDHLTAIVGDLTTLALADARQLRVERNPVELSGIIHDLIDHTAPLAAERNISLRPELNGGIHVQADVGRLRQLFLILMDNALRYTPAGGEVWVEVARRNGRAQVTVADDGPGIAVADLPHIFERFNRADKARTRESGGTGLGLAIAKWIVDAHRGDIEVRSTPGRGTRVSVTLPAID
jgi:signal transduction histidine kinase